MTRGVVAQTDQKQSPKDGGKGRGKVAEEQPGVEPEAEPEALDAEVVVGI